MTTGKLDRTNTFSAPFKVVGGDSGHNRLFVWGVWNIEGKDDGRENEDKEEDIAVLAVMVAFSVQGPWFPYHEGNFEPVEDEKERIIGEELATLEIAEDGWRVLKDISGLFVRLELSGADEATMLNYHLI